MGGNHCFGFSKNIPKGNSMHTIVLFIVERFRNTVVSQKEILPAFTVVVLLMSLPPELSTKTQLNFYFSQHAHFPASGRSILYLILSPLKCFVQIPYLSFHLIFLATGLCKRLFTWRDCDYDLIITRNEFRLI